MSKDFYTAVKDRRSIYGISRDMDVSDERIVEIIENALLHTPSAYNSQSGRIAVLLGENHLKLWEIIKGVLKDMVPSDRFPATEAKIDSFAAGYGTILFFEDENVIKELMEDYPLYREHFPMWSQQSNGMLQYVVWTSLSAEGIGATLQHYNPLIDGHVREGWDIPDSWRLIAQMPFGKPVEPADEKEFLPMGERLKVFGFIKR
jgi:uncharacterized protein